MVKSTLFLLIFTIFISACNPQSTQNLQTQPTASPLPSATLSSTPTQTATPTQIPPTPTNPPTPTPTLSPEPVRFNLQGYQKIAILRDNFPGISALKGDRLITIISSSLSPDGNLIAIAGCWGQIMSNGNCETRRSGFLFVVDTNTGDVTSEIPLGSRWPGNIAFTPDGSKLLVTTDDYKVFFWDLQTNKESKTIIDLAYSGATRYPDVSISPDGANLAVVLKDTLYVWDFSGKVKFHVPAYPGIYNAGLSYSPSGTSIAMFSMGRTGIDLLDASTGKLIHKFSLEKIGGISFSPDGKYIAGFNYDKNIVTVWDLVDNNKIAEIETGVFISSITFSPESDILLVGGFHPLNEKDDYSKIAKLYKTADWTFLDDFYSPFFEGKIKFSQNGEKMAIVESGGVAIWGEPDASLLAGINIVKKFQLALSQGKYKEAADLFMVDEYASDSLASHGLDLNDVPGSFERLCTAQTIFCYPVRDIVRIGHDWDYMVYLVHLESPSGGTFTGPKGSTVIYIYVKTDESGNHKITSLPIEY